MATTTQSITDEQIDSLGRNSAIAGDILQAAICAKATGDPYDFYALDTAERTRVDAMSQAEARAECARVIADAEAQD